MESEDCVRELDDSGCVQDAVASTMEQHPEYEGVELLDLSDDALLCILRFCSPMDLKALSYTHPRLARLALEWPLWTRVNACDVPYDKYRLFWLLRYGVNERTTHLAIRGHAEEADGCAEYGNRIHQENLRRNHIAAMERELAMGVEWNGEEVRRNPTQIGPAFVIREMHPLNVGPEGVEPAVMFARQDTILKQPSFKSTCPSPKVTLTRGAMHHLKSFCNLTSLTLHYCNINMLNTGLECFPPTLKRLCLRGTRCYYMTRPHKTFLFKLHDYLPDLEYMNVSECVWLEPSSLLALSKLTKLEELHLRECPRMTEFVAYAALATRFGFPKLRLIDFRGSPVGDSEVSAFSSVPSLLTLRCATNEHSNQEIPHEHSETPFDWEVEIPEFLKKLEMDHNLDDNEDEDAEPINLTDADQQVDDRTRFIRYLVGTRCAREGQEAENQANNAQNAQNGEGNGQNGEGNGQNGDGNGQNGDGNGQNGDGNGQNGDGNGQNGDGNGQNGEESGRNDVGNVVSAVRVSVPEDLSPPAKKRRVDNENRDCPMPGTSKDSEGVKDDGKSGDSGEGKVSGEVKGDGMGDGNNNGNAGQDIRKRKPRKIKPHMVNIEKLARDINESYAKMFKQNQERAKAKRANAEANRKIKRQRLDVAEPIKYEVVEKPDINVANDELANNEEKMDTTEPKPDISAPNSNTDEQKPDIEPNQDINEPNPDINEPNPDINEPKPDVSNPNPENANPENANPENANLENANPENANPENANQLNGFENDYENGHGNANQNDVHFVRIRLNERPMLLRQHNNVPIVIRHFAGDVNSYENRQIEAHFERERNAEILNERINRHANDILNANQNRYVRQPVICVDYGDPYWRHRDFDINERAEQDSLLVTDSAILRFGTSNLERVNVILLSLLPTRAKKDSPPQRSNLEELVVNGYRMVTDRSLIHLATAAPRLRLLDLRRTKVTAQGVEAFKNLRPDCEVLWSDFDQGGNEE